MQDDRDLVAQRPRRRLQGDMDEDEEWKAELIRYILFAFNIIIFVSLYIFIVCTYFM